MQHRCCVIGFPYPRLGLFGWFPKFFSYDLFPTVNDLLRFLTSLIFAYATIKDRFNLQENRAPHRCA